MWILRFSSSVVALANVLLLTVLVVASQATSEEGNGVIAYAVGGGEQNYVLRTINADGTHDRRLIGPTRLGGGFYRGPSGAQWSADGKNLLFGGHTHLDREATELWSATAAGKRITRIPLGLPRPLRLYGWDWAPDGRRVVFAAGSGQARVRASRIYTIGIDGSKRNALTRGDRPSWSNDGRYIVFQRDYVSVGNAADRRGVFIMRSDGSGLRRLTSSTDDHNPVFSPDGRHVAFVREPSGWPLPASEQHSDWHIIGRSGRGDTVIKANYWLPVQFRYKAPQWTPDGRRLAAVREESIGGDRPRHALVTVGPTGADERVEFTFPAALSGYTYYASDFSWQPR